MAETDRKRESFDSDQQYLGSVYAKALLGAAEKSGETETVLSELDSVVADVLDKMPNLEASLSSPRVPVADQVGIIEKAFAGGSKTLVTFLKVVVEHGRFNCVRAMRLAARRLYNEAQGRVEVEVRTAEAVDSELLGTISSGLQSRLKREVELTASIDPDLIGGMVVRVGDTVFDGSVANRLNRFRDKALDQAVREIRGSLERFEVAD